MTGTGLIIVLLLLSPLGCAAGDPPAAPLKLQLNIVDDQTISATVCNVSKQPQRLLCDSNLQPSQPKLTDSAGHVIELTDDRAIKKFNPAPTQESYTAIAAGADLQLEKARLVAEPDGTFTLRWGPYTASGLTRQKYTLQLSMDCRHQDFQDDQTGQPGRLADVWTGQLLSNTVDLDLRAATTRQ